MDNAVSNSKGNIDVQDRVKTLPGTQISFPVIDIAAKFGYAIASLGDRVVIGAPGSDRQGTNAGIAFIVDAQGQNSLIELSNPVAAEEAGFGESVAVNSSYAIVGAPSSRRVDEGIPGSVHLFDLQTGDWKSSISAPDGENPSRFGEALAVDGDRVVISAPLLDKVYIYNISDISAPVLESSVSSPSPIGSRSFGKSVAVSGEWVVIGEPLANRPSAYGRGAAFLYNVTSLNIAELDASVSTKSAAFGFAVAISGERILVSAPGAKTRSLAGLQQFVSVFDLQTQKRFPVSIFPPLLLDSTVPETERFGQSLSVDGNAVLVGDGSNVHSKNAAYVFSLETGGGVQVINTPDEKATQNFGHSVSMSEGVIMIGAPSTSGTFSGEVFRFPSPLAR